MHDLDGKVAIVTGAARGTGAAIAKRLAQAGARVILGDLLHEQGEAVARAIGAAARYLPHDVTIEADWERVVARALGEFGRIDILVNNAAILHIGALERTTTEQVRRILDVNLVGAFLGLRAVIDPMRRQGGGSVVNVGSIDGMLGMNGIGAYAASKWGLRGLTKSAAMELGREGIRVNCICPSGGNAEMFGPWFEAMAPFRDETRAYLANRGIPGEVPLEGIADAVVFLASDASRHCTGIDLPVDGGAHAGRFLPGFNTL